MNFYHPEMEQKVGTVLGGIIGIFTPAVFQVAINAAIGGVVGFLVTTLCRYLWEKIKERWLKK